MHTCMNHCMIHIQGILGGNFPIERLHIVVEPLPAHRAALSFLLPYNKGAILLSREVLLAHRRWNQATPSQLERNGMLWNGTVSLRGRKGGHRSLPNNGDQLPFDLHWHQSTIFEQMDKNENILKSELPTSSYLYGRVSCKLILGWTSSQTWGVKKKWGVKAQES